MSDLPVKDSGRRQEFSTGAVRDTSEGKGWYDALQFEAIRRDAILLEKGGNKYSKNNWRKGMPLSRFLNSALRHLCQYADGCREEDHLAAARFNIAGIIETERQIKAGKLPAELDDLVRYKPEESKPVKQEKLLTGLRSNCNGRQRDFTKPYVYFDLLDIDEGGVAQCRVMGKLGDRIWEIGRTDKEQVFRLSGPDKDLSLRINSADKEMSVWDTQFSTDTDKTEYCVEWYEAFKVDFDQGKLTVVPREACL